MKTTFAWIPTALGCLWLMGATAHADTFISCPTEEVTTRIANPLPKGWTGSQAKARLTDTRVVERRGPDRLQCVYGTVGTLEFRAPRRERCVAFHSGFRCERRGREERVESEGRVTMRPAVPVDLDTGRSASGRRGDIWMRASSPFQRYIEPINGARLAPINVANPTRRDCRQADYGERRVPVLEMLGPNWICYVTSNGRYGRLRLTGMGLFPVTLDMTYTTWERPRR